MKYMLMAGLVAASLMTGGVAHASADQAKAAGCMKCHDVDKKKMASSFKDIAAKNKGNKDFVSEATKKLTSAAGHPKVSASEADVKAIMEWIVTL